MKGQIHRAVTPDRLERIAPPAIANQLTARELAQPETVVIAFPTDRETVIRSREVSKALSAAGDLVEPGRVAFGGTFTSDSIELLTAAGFTLFQTEDWYWTDESYTEIRGSRS